VRNKSVRSALKTEAKKVRAAADQAAAGETADRAAEQFRLAARSLDQAASRGVVHKRTAARKKSRLARILNG
jgi:small subunit ribosomal protein S20